MVRRGGGVGGHQEEPEVRIARFQHQGRPRWGIVEDGDVYLADGSIYESPSKGERVGPLDSVTLLAPAEPSKLVCYAGNYKKLISRDGRPLPDLTTFEPMLFLKSPTCVVGPGDDVVYPSMCEWVQHEVEICFVVKRRARNVSVEDAPGYILGYTCGNDITAANVHGRDHHLARSKSFDTFAPIGPTLVTDLRTDDLALRLWHNGELVVEDRTSDRVWNDAQVLSHASRVMTLEVGDVVMTGTPNLTYSDNRRVRPGDRMEIEIEGIGRLANQVAADG
jgi:2-keto-4-pentenoate hydratase/2-oxohepta-3-ene-1,7-dioic acid hydratase in catechol pathway